MSFNIYINPHIYLRKRPINFSFFVLRVNTELEFFQRKAFQIL